MPVWLLLVIVTLTLAAGLGLAWASELDTVLFEPSSTTTPTVPPTSSPTATASSTPTPTSTPTATSTSTPKPDRTSCDRVRGTKYRSRSERKWYLDKCVTPTMLAPRVSVQGGDWRSLVCSYNWDCDWAMAVMYCESGGNPNAYNPGGPYVGLFQILGSSASLFDPATNVAEAHWKYLTQGRGAWPVCQYARAFGS